MISDAAVRAYEMLDQVDEDEEEKIITDDISETTKPQQPEGNTSLRMEDALTI